MSYSAHGVSWPNSLSNRHPSTCLHGLLSREVEVIRLTRADGFVVGLGVNTQAIVARQLGKKEFFFTILGSRGKSCGNRRFLL